MSSHTLRERNHSLDDLDTFVRVAEAGSLSAAAEQLGVPPSTVSRRVTRLEDALGVALLHREHRRVGLTADGEALYRRTRTALRELDEVASDLDGDEVQGVLRLTAGVGATARHGFAAMLSAFREAHPAVHIELRVSNRVVDLVEEGVDVAFRPYTPQTPMRSGDLRIRMLGGAPFGLYAAPELAEVDVAALDGLLIGHPILRIARMASRFFPGWSRLHACSTPIVVDDFDSVVALAAAGAGVAVAPELVAAHLLEDGRLVRVCTELDLGGSEMCLMWPASRHLAPRVRAFVDHCVAWAPRLGLEPPGTWKLGAI
ncbi:MAG: LysR family transcriptional regulator [Deltaproteobacteria bacterium]|nr:MAG: LysR family transcriptional regulator [Deltaproteobacteria bacterium]